MTRHVRALCVAPALVAVTVLSCGAAGAADKTKVDAATKQVEQGAKQSSSRRRSAASRTPLWLRAGG